MALKLTLTNDDCEVIATWTIGETREELEHSDEMCGYEHDMYAEEGYPAVSDFLSDDVASEICSYYEREGKV